ncbi:MAG: nitronate monooxygenase [Alphaproteobacteria bacterium]|nr:nitronate monooxygenase [Alphaproteobacteria bacterium]
MKTLNPFMISGAEALPLIEGGKGVAVSTGMSSGAWAGAGGIGTFSGVNADSFKDDGTILPQTYSGRTRKDRHEELVKYAIDGGIAQAQIAHEMRNGEGRLHVNILWEMGGAERVLHGIMEKCRGMVHGVTCGAGMPYKLAELATQYEIYYYPIISSARAFRALWKRAYHKCSEYLGGVVYEDPWLAGGHNGLSNSEDPLSPEDPYPRVVALRAIMNEAGLNDVPIVMAGGVWWLSEWDHWLDNPEVGPVCFQFGTRPLLTEESEISDDWKKRLLTLDPGDVLLHKFSPTGFYSSAVKNDFIDELVARSEHQIAFSPEPVGAHDTALGVGARKREVFVTAEDKTLAESWVAEGRTDTLKTPDSTLIYVTPEKAEEIRADQIACMGCLSSCQFSNWSENEKGSTGRKADPRSFCIQKTLQNIVHDGAVDSELMFAGHNAYRFSQDPWYKDGFIPTVKQLVERIKTGM